MFTKIAIGNPIIKANDPRIPLIVWLSYPLFSRYEVRPIYKNPETIMTITRDTNTITLLYFICAPTNFKLIIPIK